MTQEIEIFPSNEHLQSIINDADNYSERFLDSPDFEKLLLSFGTPNDEKVNTLSLVIMTKLFEKNQQNKDLVKKRCSKFILKWIDSTEENFKVSAFAALSAIFQVDGEIGTLILLHESTLQESMDCVEFESEQVQIALVEMLSHACSQKNCRATVATHCRDYLTSTMATTKSERLKSMAAVTMAKLLLDTKASKVIENPQKNTNPFGNEVQFAQLFQDIILKNDADLHARLNAVEGLAYASLKPAVKETITYHPALLKTLFEFVKDSKSATNPLLYGVAVILSNITNYQRKLSEKEEQVLKLKKLAGEASNAEPDPLDSDERVIERNKHVLSQGTVQILNIIAKNDSLVIKQFVAQVFLNLSTDQKNRGAIVQQGGVKSMMSMISKGSTSEGIALATQSLAKIAITMDPRLAFRGERAVDLVGSFLTLCQNEKELCQFEALMALTNLGSVDDDIRERIFDAKGVPTIEYLQFSDNTMIRRAATECLCNLMFCEPVYELYSDPERSENKIKILVAFSDVEDFETRRAASGALAILSTSPDVCRMIVNQRRGIEILKDLLMEESPELQHRGVECFKNIAKVDQALAERLINNKIHERLLNLVKESKIEAVVTTSAEALKEIAKHKKQ